MKKKKKKTEHFYLHKRMKKHMSSFLFISDLQMPNYWIKSNVYFKLINLVSNFKWNLEN